MRILHVSTADHGGAGFATVRLHEALLKAGAESHLLVLDTEKHDPRITALTTNRLAQARRFAARTWSRLFTTRRYFFQYQRLTVVDRQEIRDCAVAFAPDLIVVHYISTFVNFADIGMLQDATGARIAWNLLDMALMTGGCHYAWECEGYTAECGDCPALPLRPRRDASAATMRAKRAAIAGRDQVAIAASSTLGRQLRRSSLFGNIEICTARIGIDADDFPWRERSEARRALGLPESGRVWFFGAQSLTEERKGMGLLVDALIRLQDRLSAESRPRLLIAGKVAGLGLDALDYPMTQLGYIGREQLASAYAAADLFICPSVEDSGPMMVNEALMSGTPVVGFETGILTDLVVPGVTGLLANEKTAPALAQRLFEFAAWADRQLADTRRECRALVMEKCSVSQQVEAFLGLAKKSSDGRVPQ